MTPRDKDLLTAVYDHWHRYHCGPSISDLAQKTGRERAPIHGGLCRLEEAGYIMCQRKGGRVQPHSWRHTARGIVALHGGGAGSQGLSDEVHLIPKSKFLTQEFENRARALPDDVLVSELQRRGFEVAV